MAEKETGLRETEVAPDWKEPRLLSILFCDFYNITADSKVNLIGVFDRIFVHPESKVTPVFVLFLRSRGTIEESLRVRVFAPDGTPTVGIDFAGTPATPAVAHFPSYVQSITRLQFVASIQGVYRFQVLYKGNSLGGAELVVEFREMEGKRGGTDTYY